MSQTLTPPEEELLADLNSDGKVLHESKTTTEAIYKAATEARERLRGLHESRTSTGTQSASNPILKSAAEAKGKLKVDLKSAADVAEISTVTKQSEIQSYLENKLPLNQKAKPPPTVLKT